jgi:hypothetical protein
MFLGIMVHLQEAETSHIKRATSLLFVSLSQMN